MTVVIALLLWLTLLLAGDTPFGCALRTVLVKRPAARLSRITRGHLILAFVLFMIGAAVFWLLEADGLRVLSMATPELIGWASTFEITTLLDLFAVSVLAASGLRLKNIAAAVRALVRWRGRRRAPASVRPRRPTAANDDEEGLVSVPAISEYSSFSPRAC